MDNTRKRVFLAALLHDIGKFYQRADKSLSDKANELAETSKKMIDLLCPLDNNGNFGYQHTLWTFQFLNEFENILKAIPNVVDNIYDSENRDSIYQLAAFHHKPSSRLQSIISLADCWSAGIDRKNQMEVEDGVSYGIDWGKKRYKKIPLYSVFNKINNGNFSSAFKLSSLSLSIDGCFPKDVKSASDGLSESQYSLLWSQFTKEFKDLPTDSYIGFAESLLFLLKKYTWCIPSNTTDMSNVSLYDHLKTTAAFADCLYVYSQQHPDDLVAYDNNRLTVKDGVYPVVLLGGDISGIQKFIYNIASRKAAVSLKGRSFYLQLLIDSIINRILQHPDIDATMANVVYSSGGKFYMVLPNTDQVIKTIKELRIELENDIWNEHNGQLVVNIDYLPFSFNLYRKGFDFEGYEAKPIGDLWRTMSEKLTDLKNQKFKNVLLDDYERFFTPQNVDKDAKVCAVTGIESEKCKPIDSSSDKTFVLPIVKEQIMLGQTLKNVDYILTYRLNEDCSYLSNRSKYHCNIVGVNTYLFNKEELTIDNADFRKITSSDTTRVKWINNPNQFLDAKIKGNSVSYEFQFYGGNRQAQNKDNDKTFEELADEQYLGILRMDVDNLGSIFIKGLPDEDKSFAAYSTLSFMLDYFFSGYINTIRNKDDFKDYVNVLYSGGDDVFAVGRWDKLIEFAEEIRKEFGMFVGRDDISISGGIAIVDDKFPIAKAAELAGEAEDSAKKYQNSHKDAFCMFGECVLWNKEEYDYVKSYKNSMLDLMSKGLTSGFLQKIMSYYNIIKRNEIIEAEHKQGFNKRKQNLSYIWHTAYFITRYISRVKNDDVIIFCKKLRDKELINKEKYRLVAIAARWAELELRFNKTNTNN